MLDVRYRCGGFGGLLGLTKNREKKRGEDSDDCDDDQEFDQSEGGFFHGPYRLLIFCDAASTEVT
jgi:hypothetical protein